MDERKLLENYLTVMDHYPELFLQRKRNYGFSWTQVAMQTRVSEDSLLHMVQGRQQTPDNTRKVIEWLIAHPERQRP